jgi:hypothetical protein
VSAEIIPITSRHEAAWADFVAKKTRAEQTMDVRDGIEAGKALRRFYDLFLTQEHRSARAGGAN